MLELLLILFVCTITGAVLVNMDINEPEILIIPVLLWLLVLVYMVCEYS